MQDESYPGDESISGKLIHHPEDKNSQIQNAIENANN